MFPFEGEKTVPLYIREGNDFYIEVDDEASTMSNALIFLKVAYHLARAFIVQEATNNQTDFNQDVFQKAVESLIKDTKGYYDMSKLCHNIWKNADEFGKKVSKDRKSMLKLAESLEEIFI